MSEGGRTLTARHLTIVHYPPGQAWRCAEIASPAWAEVAAAIAQMDDHDYPIVQLSWRDCASCFDDEESFNIIGGITAGFALFEMIAGWRFESPDGGEEDVRLWQSDQGYYCQRKNIVADIATVLRLTEIYFLTGSYEAVQSASAMQADAKGPF